MWNKRDRRTGRLIPRGDRALTKAERDAAYRSKHPDQPKRTPERKAYMQKYMAEYMPSYTPTQRNAYLVKHYGITSEQYEEMLEAQDGRCALCGKRSLKLRLAVDHDHTLDRLGFKVVNGLLCSRCNRALGVFEWDAQVLRRLRDYVDKIIRNRTRFAKLVAQASLEKETHA